MRTDLTEPAGSHLSSWVVDGLDEIVDIVADGIVVVNDEQKIVAFNRAAEQIFGYHAERVIGGPLDLLLPEHIRDRHAGWMSDFARSGDVRRLMNQRGAVKGRRADGTLFPAEVAIAKAQREGGVFFTAVVRDISERQQLEAQLRHAQKMKALATLAGGVAHEINNILTPIVGLTELSILKLPEDSPIRANMEKVLAASNRAADLVAQVVAFARSEQRVISVADLPSVFSRTCQLLKATLPLNITLRTQLLGNGARMSGTVTDFSEVLMNLTKNAVDAIGSELGEISIAAERIELEHSKLTRTAELQPDSYLKLSVRDSGHGMGAETMRRIFEPFFTTKSVGTGYGLGLALVYGVVEKNRGGIEVTSKMGKGTTFDVYLPVTASRCGERGA
jgi:PAS domain S-box-containing protein